jgi:hypothetical protein
MIEKACKNLLKLATSGNLRLSSISLNSGSALLLVHPQLHVMAVAAEVHDQDRMFKYQAGQLRSVKHLDKLAAGEEPLDYSGAATTAVAGASPRSVALGRRVTEHLLAASLGAAADPGEPGLWQRRAWSGSLTWFASSAYPSVILMENQII